MSALRYKQPRLVLRLALERMERIERERDERLLTKLRKSLSSRRAKRQADRRRLLREAGL